MATTYNLLGQINWYFPDLSGRPLGSGYMKTFRALDHTEFKPVYKDIAGTLPYTQPIYFDENGWIESPGTLYFASDENYYLEVYDVDDNLMRTYNNINFPTPGDEPIVASSNSVNHVINGQFLNNIGASNDPTNATDLVVAPSAHEGLVYPHIRFRKNNTDADDVITFVKFNPGESSALEGTPLYYCNYTCSGSPSGETYKIFDFPISADVNSLSTQQVVISFLGKSADGDTVDIYINQYFGSGGTPTATNRFYVDTVTLTTEWAKYFVVATVPDVTGVTLGDCGDDYLTIALQPALGAPSNIDFTNVSLIEGDQDQVYYYLTKDQVISQYDTPQTGDVKLSFQSSMPGWLPMDDGSIGSATSGALTRANIDTFPLYYVLWNNVADSWAPVPFGRGASAADDFSANKELILMKTLGRAIASGGNFLLSPPFTVNTGTNELSFSAVVGGSFYNGSAVTVSSSGTLPDPLMAATTYYVIKVSSTNIKLALTLEDVTTNVPIDITTAGTGVLTITVEGRTWALGEYVGEETELLMSSEVPPTDLLITGKDVRAEGVFANNVGYEHDIASGTSYGFDDDSTVVNGGSQPHNIMQPTTRMNLFIKL